MSVVVLTSAAGAPGVTTTALGLTLCWPRDVVLLDADRSGSQAVLAGYLNGDAPVGGGLQSLLQAHREWRPFGETMATAWRPLRPLDPRTDLPAAERRFVPGFTHLGSVDLFDTAWERLLEAHRDAPYDLVIDAGRTGHRGLPSGLLGGADVVGMVCRSSLQAAAALRLHVPPLVEVGAPGRVGLVVVGAGRPYAGAEIAAQFGVPVVAEVAWDPAAAEDLQRPGPVPRRWPRTPLARSLMRAVERVGAMARAGASTEDGAA